MSLHNGASYDLRKIEPDEEDIDITDWSFISSINSKTIYALIKKDPIDYFDGRHRYIVSNKRDKSEPKYAYCVLFNCSSGTFEEDLLADFLF